MEKDAMTIAEFCRRHGISRGMYYKLPRDQRPTEMRVGRRVLITREAAEAWRRHREADA